jgi:hypothetical protein
LYPAALRAVPRLIAPELSNRFGQPVSVENRPGGAAIIGTQAVDKAAPDGYTILLGSTNISTNSTLYEKPPYEADKDLVPITFLIAFDQGAWHQQTQKICSTRKSPHRMTSPVLLGLSSCALFLVRYVLTLPAQER